MVFAINKVCQKCISKCKQYDFIEILECPSFISNDKYKLKLFDSKK